MDNPEKLATLGTQDTTRWQTKQKHSTIICVGYHFTQTNTNNINKTWAFLQTTRNRGYTYMEYLYVRG